MFRKLLSALLAIALIVAPAKVWAAGEQFPPGTVFGNDTAAQRTGKVGTLTALFDRAYCSTIGYVIARTTGGWTCDRNIPLKASYYGVVCDGTTPMSANLQTAVNAAKAAGGIPVELPAPTTTGALCVHNANVFTNVWLPANGVLSTPGIDLRGPGRDVTVIDTRVANGAAFSTNPDWQAAYKTGSLISASTGGSGALTSNTYYVLLTVTDPGANEVLVSQTPAAYVVTGPTGRISLPLQPLNTGHCYNAYISTSPTTVPDHYGIVNGTDAICVAGNQTVFINAVGSAHAYPTNKRAAWQSSNFSGFSIGNSTNVAGAIGISWFKTAYSTIDKMQIQSVVDGIQITNYAGDADGSINPKITQVKLDHISGLGVNAVGAATNLSYLYLENVICNICGTLPANYKTPANYGTGFAVSNITQNATNVLTTSAPHTLATNDEIYLSSVGGMTQLVNGWYRVNVTGATTLNLEDLVTGSIIDTSGFNAYTSGGIAALAWRPPTAANGLGGGFAWTGLTATIVHSACTQANNACFIASEAGGSSDLKMIGVTSENTIGVGFYIGSLNNGSAENLECLSTTSIGATHKCIQEGTGYNAGGVANFKVHGVKIRSDVAIATQFVQYRNTNNPTAAVDSNRITGVQWFAYDSVTTQSRFLNFAFDPIPGQVRLSVPQTNVWKIDPTGAGSALPVHLGSVRGDGEWVSYKVPDAGITFAVTTSAPNTTYNVYTYNSGSNSAPIAISVSADTATPATNNGYKVQSTGLNTTFVGTLTTDAVGNFQPSGIGTSWFGPGTAFVQSAGRQGSLTATISIANPAVITTATHGMTAAANNCTIANFTTTGALPNGGAQNVVAGTNYYLTVTGTTTFQVSTSIANCFNGVFLNTSGGSQSGTQTAVFNGVYSTTNTAVDVAAVQVPPGDWEAQCIVYFDPAVGTTVTNFLGWVNNVAATGNFVAGGYATLNLPAITGTTLTGGPGNSPISRWSSASTQILFCGGRQSFSGTATNIYGSIRARRINLN